MGAKNLATPGFESRTVQPVESRCSDYAVQTNAVFGTISNENMADGRTCEAGATWQQLGSALGSQQFKTLKLSRNFIPKEIPMLMTFKGNYSIRSKTIKNENSPRFLNTEVYKQRVISKPSVA